MSGTNSTVSQTMWVWPTGLFPRRVMYYLKAKRLPLSVLRTASNPEGPLHIVRIRLDMQAGGFVPVVSGDENRPDGCSLPVLRTSGPNSAFVRQSASLLQYLEDCYPSTDNQVDLSGASLTPQGRAAMRDIIQLIDESIAWMGVESRHSRPEMLRWNGMTKDEMSPGAAVDAQRQWKKAITKLEGWVRESIIDKGALSLVGVKDAPTLADFALAAPVEYLREMRGLDLLEGCEALKLWHQRFTESKYFVTREELERLEKDGLEELFV